MRHILARGNQLRPVRFAGSSNRSRHQAVTRVGIVDADVEDIIAFVGFIANTFLSRLDDLPLSGRSVSRQELLFAGYMAARIPSIRYLSSRVRSSIDVIALVLLVEDDGIGRSIGAKHVAVHQVAAFRLRIFSL